MTTKGKIIEQAAPSATHFEADGTGANPPTGPETPQEESMWKKASPWVHGALGVASFIPGVSVVSGGLDAAIYAGEGNMLEAGLAAASMIPGGKVVTTAGKVVKGAVGLAKEAELAAKVAKGAHEAEELAKAAKLAKEAEDAAKIAKEAQLAKEAKAAKEAEEAAAKKAKEAKEAEEATKKAEKDTTVKKRNCKHLEKGPPGAAYQGGKHGKVKHDSVRNVRESHHMPPDSISPRGHSEGVAISMDYKDHRALSSTGRKTTDPFSIAQEKLAKSGPAGYLAAMMVEITEIRAIANPPDKYDAAIAWALLYAACMGFIPSPKK